MEGDGKASVNTVVYTAAWFVAWAEQVLREQVTPWLEMWVPVSADFGDGKGGRAGALGGRNACPRLDRVWLQHPLYAQHQPIKPLRLGA